jgi:hypothetical protein
MDSDSRARFQWWVLTLKATDNGDGKNFDHADWANARLV